ncbi:methyl-accepting chemotaxis sensory transducer [Anaeromyxobacter sp. K]|uniref:Methyl-accepting chemotaxis sensory transducer n=1 Tax=Anaeromyxobacter dehalogenans (strain ATCC BAA-258 / DSM 21875 / 2CP-1) TaxID=455488 RepID=B8JCW6_ANAD2|nr:MULTISPECIES: methyl-accepting chemotaxis protein [Anaeromyxobacter]ACG71885.1 methyl-accepting chemotaxis sensory transducer [Anaeromyxobacter sp. K]ACL63994.1 methyl-accepting chemotaxis sensory transducer [Anaeromyxobacter dehalogenans 2CP-1]
MRDPSELDKPKKKPARAARPARKTGVAPGDALQVEAFLRSFAAGEHGVARLDVSAFADPMLRGIAEAANAAADHAAGQLDASRQRVQVVTAGVDEAIEAMIRLVIQGDLSGTLRLGVSDAALAPLIAGIGQVMETLKRFVTEIREAALQLSTSSAEVLAAATQNESSTSAQASAIHETTATMEELKGASHQIAENAQMVAAIAEQTLTGAKQGEGAIKSFMSSMEKVRHNAVEVDDAIAKLSKRVERIGTVVEVIDEIADRSDLLALNAALEGAKAGEAGRGFSIVAAEMRRLAENVMESTKEIKNLITEIREATHAAKEASDGNKRMAAEGEQLGGNAMTSVSGILSGIQETSDAARVIHLATQQQRTATEQVVQSMSEIEEVTRQAQTGSKQATGAASELTKLAERLAELVKRFKVE